MNKLEKHQNEHGNNMKTPPYQIKAMAAYRKRRKKDGWRYFNVLVSPEHHEKLKAFHEKLKG